MNDDRLFHYLNPPTMSTCAGKTKPIPDKTTYQKQKTAQQFGALKQ